MIKAISKGVCAPAVCHFTSEVTGLTIKKIANIKHKYYALKID